MGARELFLRLEILLMVSLSAVAFYSCTIYSTGSGTPVVTSCNIPSDQSGSINGHWQVVPVNVAVQQGTFSSTDQAAVTAAADTWNQFFTSSMNIKVINYGGVSGSPTTTTNNDPVQNNTLCSQTMVQGNQFTGTVGIYKLTTWPSSYSQTAIALTTSCTQTAQPFPNMYSAVIELNYQKYFNGTLNPDLQSILTHEFGHLMGLKHSCEVVNTPGIPNCSESNLDPDYEAASMFPVFSFDASGNGQVKRSLGTNDESRANCLYTSGSASPTPSPT